MTHELKQHLLSLSLKVLTFLMGVVSFALFCEVLEEHGFFRGKKDK